MDTFEARLRRVEDELELRGLVERYAMAVDDQDGAALAECYASDAEFERGSAHSKGCDEVVAYLQRQTARYGPSIHIPHSQVVTWVDEHHARGVCTGHAELALGGRRVVAAFRYHDEYVREDGSWRFRSRRIRFVYAVPSEQLPDIFTNELRSRWPGTEPAPADIPESIETWRAGKELATWPNT